MYQVYFRGNSSRPLSPGQYNAFMYNGMPRLLIIFFVNAASCKAVQKSSSPLGAHRHNCELGQAQDTNESFDV